MTFAMGGGGRLVSVIVIVGKVVGVIGVIICIFARGGKSLEIGSKNGVGEEVLKAVVVNLLG